MILKCPDPTDPKPDAFETRMHTARSTATTETAAEAAAEQPTSSGSSAAGWPSEPGTLAELDAKYDTLMSCPGRNPTTMLKMVKEKGQVEQEGVVIEKKLFLAPCRFAYECMFSLNPSPLKP